MNLGQPALHLLKQAKLDAPGFEEVASLARDAVVKAAANPEKVGLLKADLLGALADLVPAERGVPVLVANLTDNERNNIVREGLVRYGKPSVKPLMEAVRTLKPGLPKDQAMLALGQIGEDAVEAVPLLVEILKQGDMQVFTTAARALGEFGPLAKDALPALREIANQGMFGARAAKEAIAKIEGKGESEGK
jgi:hypothetical protein